MSGNGEISDAARLNQQNREELDKVKKQTDELEAQLLKINGEIARAEGKLLARKKARALNVEAMTRWTEPMPNMIANQNDSIIKLHQETFKLICDVMRDMDRSMQDMVESEYLEKVVLARVLLEMGEERGEDGDATKYVQWMEENVRVSAKKVEEAKEKWESHLEEFPLD